MCPSHGDAYAPSSRAQPASVDTTTSRPVAARLPCRLHPRGRVRTRCAPPAAPPPRPDHTHVRLSRGRGSRPGKAAEPVQCPPPPLTPGWSSVTQGSARPHPTHRPPYPPTPSPGLPPWPKATLTLFGAPAGRSVFSLPAGPDANVEKDGSSASLTAMSDSPGGCLWAGWGAHGGKSQGPTLDHHSGVSHPDPHPLPSPRAAPTSLMWGPRRSSGGRSSGDTRTPKSTKRGKKRLRNEVKTKTPNCPRSFFFGVNINGRCLFFLKSSFVYKSS